MFSARHYIEKKLESGEYLVETATQHWMTCLYALINAWILLVVAVVLKAFLYEVEEGDTFFFSLPLLLPVLLMVYPPLLLVVGGIVWAYKSDLRVFLTNKRVLFAYPLSRDDQAFAHVRVTSVHCKQSALGKKLGYGTLVFAIPGEQGNSIVYPGELERNLITRKYVRRPDVFMTKLKAYLEPKQLICNEGEQGVTTLCL